MRVERTLQIVLALLSLLGAFLLGMGKGDSLIPTLMLVAAPTSLIFTDRYGWLQLNRPLANAAALGAVGFTLLDFLRNSGQNQLFAIANLLLYLQLVLLFQEKNLRVYWQLLVLSLLEVVVAAAMNLSFHFGFLLLIYLALALAALQLQFVLRETRRWSPEPETTEREIMSTRVGRPVIALALMTLAFSAAIFYATPRIDGTTWSGGGGRRQAQVGFSRNISLDEMGRILESDELAMRVSFFDLESGVPYDVVGQTYFRGAVLTRYSPGNDRGRWSPSVFREEVPLAEAPPGLRNLVAQEIWLQPTRQPTLFTVAPAYRVQETPGEVTFDPRSSEMLRSSSGPLGSRGRWQYRVATSGLVSGRVLPLLPDAPSTDVIRKQEYFSEVRDCEEFDRRKFPRIAEAAERILREANALDADRVRKARVLESHFLQSGSYTYSLDLGFRRDASVDPIEDFVARHRTGHCEYFATALVLMLRSQKIPARLVVGYKGGELNAVGNYLLVRQRDAHAWVEMHVDPEEVEMLSAGEWQYPGSGAWWRLDPTPGMRDESADSASLRSQLDQMLDYVEFLWSDYVQGLGPERQRDSVYDPVTSPWREWSERWLDVRLWPRRMAELATWIRVQFQQRPVLASLVSLVSLGLIVFLLRKWRERFRSLFNKLVHGMRRWWNGQSIQAGERPSIEFYERFEDLLARRGMMRPPGATPLEWLAELAGNDFGRGGTGDQRGRVAESHRDIGSAKTAIAMERLLPAAQRIVQAFYRAKYHGEALEPAEVATLDEDLREIAHSLTRADPTERRPASPTGGGSQASRQEGP